MFKSFKKAKNKYINAKVDYIYSILLRKMHRNNIQPTTSVSRKRSQLHDINIRSNKMSQRDKIKKIINKKLTLQTKTLKVLTVIFLPY